MAFDEQWYGETRDAILRPVTPENPCGPDLEYDQAYLELFTKLVPKETKVVRQVAGKPTLETKLEPVPWQEAERDCLNLLKRSRDLRLLIVLIRCRTRRDHGPALAWGLSLLTEILELWPQDAHPSLWPDGEYEPQARAAALSELTAQEGLLADIRRIPVFSQAAERRELRHVEQSLSLPRPKQADPPEQARRGLQELRERDDENLIGLIEALELARKLDEIMSPQLKGADFSLDALIALLACLEPSAAAPGEEDLMETTSEATEPAGGAPAPDGAGPSKPSPKTARVSGRQLKSPAPPSSPPAPVAAADIPDRLFAREQIGEIRKWFECNEPSSPIVLLLGQAEALVGKRFSELLSFLPHEILERWDKNGD